MSGLSLVQKLAIVKFLTDCLVALRADDLLPQAERELCPGARLPVKFGGQLAGWVNVPKASVRVTITDEAKYEAWVAERYPMQVEETETVKVTPELIEHQRVHFPSAIITTESVRQGFTEVLCRDVKDRGGYLDRASGEKITDIPGVTRAESPAVPRVNLEDNAGQVIGAAWSSLDLRDMLALPAGENT